ncbi:MAG: CHRD domain-containing protein, partial [Solirubrobacteraceae bacterium]
MRSRVFAGAAAGIGLAVGILLSPIGGAFAGHTNKILQADLDGRQEVKTGATNKAIVGDPSGRGEAYVFGIDGDPKTFCYVLTVDKIALAEPGMSAHIHKGAAGANGPVVANLARPFDGDAADCLTEGEILPNGASAFPTGEKVADILANPSAYYVNVHNPDCPGGAIRGQLRGRWQAAGRRSR